MDLLYRFLDLLPMGYWPAICIIGMLVCFVLLFREAILSDPMYNEIKLHSEKIKQLEFNGQSQEILEENNRFVKIMRGLAESDHASSVPRGFLPF